MIAEEGENEMRGKEFPFVVLSEFHFEKKRSIGKIAIRFKSLKRGVYPESFFFMKFSFMSLFPRLIPQR